MKPGQEAGSREAYWDTVAVIQTINGSSQGEGEK